MVIVKKKKKKTSNMKIAITTVGSRGDLQPFISLGLGLKKLDMKF